MSLKTTVFLFISGKQSNGILMIFHYWGSVFDFQNTCHFFFVHDMTEEFFCEEIFLEFGDFRDSSSIYHSLP